MMNRAEPARSQHLLGIFLAALLLSGPALGCKRTTVAPKPINIPGATNTADDTLDSARDKLYATTDLASCQGTVRQLNVYLGGHSDAKATPRPDADRARLGFSADEWVEVNNINFTPLDAHYLEQCFLLRDAAQSLQVAALPPAQQAEAAFRWVVRQVRVVPRPGEILSPAAIVRRGSGTPAQRTAVFLALLQQMNIDGCLVAFPGKETVALPAALAEGQLYLFDSRLGLPLPGKQSGSVATLAQLRAAPELVTKLSPEAQHPYDLTAEQVKKAEVYLLCGLSESAPRLRKLQQLLEPRVKVVLALDVDGLDRKLQVAGKELGVPVKVWNREGDVGSPARALREFLPREDGGVDVPHRVALRNLPGYDMPSSELVNRWTRKQIYEIELIPWTAFPRPLLVLPPNSSLGNGARYLFRSKYIETLLRKDEPARSFVLEEAASGPGDDPDRNQPARASTEETSQQLPRNLILRGRFQDAAQHFVRVSDHVSEFRKIRSANPDLDEQVILWREEATTASQEIRLGRGKLTSAEEEQARRQLSALISKPALVAVCLDALSDPLAAEAAYSIALNNHEQAERLRARAPKGTAASSPQLQEAWQAAADGWWAFALKKHVSHPAALSAHRLHAEALEALGDTEKARATWENLANGIFDNKAAPLSDLEKTACLIRAARLKK